MNHKGEVDRRVANELGLTTAEVSRITTEFIRQMGEFLAEAGMLTIANLGRFRVEVVRLGREVKLTEGGFKKGIRGKTRKVVVPSFVRVHFSKSNKLKELLDESFRE